jgi:hypothetical protein
MFENLNNIDNNMRKEMRPKLKKYKVSLLSIRSAWNFMILNLFIITNLITISSKFIFINCVIYYYLLSNENEGYLNLTILTIKYILNIFKSIIKNENFY